eukprot:gene2466-3048_t
MTISESLNNLLNNEIDKKEKVILTSTSLSGFKESDPDLCERNVIRALKSDPRIYTLMREMVKSGCLPPVIKCKPCIQERFGYFDPGEGLVVCDNVKTYKDNIKNTLLHEMTHAYDMCKVNLDTQNCKHIACTEIRASTLSGECAWFDEFSRGKVSTIFSHFPDCVKRRAILSLKNNPNCKDTAERTINDVWDKCSKDYSPFLTIPK